MASLKKIKENDDISDIDTANGFDLNHFKWIKAYSGLLENSLKVFLGDLPANVVVDMKSVITSSEGIGLASFYAPLQNEIRKCPGKRMLSIACGSGKMVVDFLLEGKDRTAVAIDRAPAAIEAVYNKAEEAGVHEKLQVKQMDIAQIPEHAGLFDGVEIIELAFGLHDMVGGHGRDKALQVLKTLYESLHPDGFMLITEAMRSKPESRPFSHIFNIVHEIQRITLPTDDEWQALFQAAGFNIVDVVDAIMPESRIYVLGKKRRAPKIHAVPVMKEIPGHKSLVPFYLCSEVSEEIPLDLVAVHLGPLLKDGIAGPHTHTQDEYYVLPAYPDPVEIEITIESRTYKVISPAVVHIPAGSRHQFRPVRYKMGQFILGVFPRKAVQS